MAANSYTRVIFESPAALRVCYLLAGLALAPIPIFHSYPIGFLIYLFESPPAGWIRITFGEAYWFTLLGLPLAPIFLAWALPGASRPGVPLRSVGALWFLLAYNPLRHFFEAYLYGDKIARVADFFGWESPLLWSIWRLDTPLLIGLAATIMLRRHTLRPLAKIPFHWALFLCVLWAAGPLYDHVLHEAIFWTSFRR